MFKEKQTNDLFYITLFAFKSFHGKYLVAEPNGELNANRNVAGPWETFRVVNMCPDWLGLGICK